MSCVSLNALAALLTVSLKFSFYSPTPSLNCSILLLAHWLAFERGSVGTALEQVACKYLPQFGNNGKEIITVRQLLTHTAGLHEFYPFFDMGLTKREEVIVQLQFLQRLLWNISSNAWCQELLFASGRPSRGMDTALRLSPSNFWCAIDNNLTSSSESDLSVLLPCKKLHRLFVILCMSVIGWGPASEHWHRYWITSWKTRCGMEGEWHTTVISPWLFWV
jgi:hypothetical protein